MLRLRFVWNPLEFFDLAGSHWGHRPRNRFRSAWNRDLPGGVPPEVKLARLLPPIFPVEVALNTTMNLQFNDWLQQQYVTMNIFYGFTDRFLQDSRWNKKQWRDCSVNLKPIKTLRRVVTNIPLVQRFHSICLIFFRSDQQTTILQMFFSPHFQPGLSLVLGPLQQFVPIVRRFPSMNWSRGTQLCSREVNAMSCHDVLWKDMMIGMTPIHHPIRTDLETQFWMTVKWNVFNTSSMILVLPYLSWTWSFPIVSGEHTCWAKVALVQYTCAIVATNQAGKKLAFESFYF